MLFSQPKPSAFVPTVAQRRLLSYIEAHPSYRNITDLCESAGVNRRTYYHWNENPQFRLWFATAWSARIIMDVPVLLSHARVLAKSSFSYWKAMLTLSMDPKGLALFQHWQQTCAQLPSDAFIEPEAEPQTASAHATVRSPVQSNQPLPPPSCLKNAPSASPHVAASGVAQSAQPALPTPLQHVRALRTLAKLASNKPPTR